MTRPVTFRKADLVRACEGVTESGLTVARVEINDNGIVVIVGEPEKASRTKQRTLADRLYGPQA